MKTLSTIIFIALFAVGCSRSGSQTPVQSAHDVVDETTSSLDSSEGDELYDERPLDESLASSSDAGDLETAADADAGGDSPGESVGTDEAAGGDDAASFDALIAASWQSASSQRLYLAVKEIGDFGDRAVVPLAHFRRGSRNVVIAWPVTTANGALGGSAVYGVCAEETSDGGFESCGERWLVNEVTSSMASLEQALGGADYTVVSNQTSASLDRLGTNLSELGNAFVTAAGARDGAMLFRTAQEFMLMLPVHDIAFTNALPQLLVEAARGNKSFSFMKSEVGDLLASITCKVDGEMYEVTLLSLTAERVDGQSNAWRIVDYW